jgi:chemotaxis protein MotB
MSTYTDLMTLLLTFFVLLLSLSTVDKTKKLRALNSLVGALVLSQEGSQYWGEKGINITTGARLLPRRKYSLKDFVI